uniref:Neurexin/syndecan/glycophorin C domain-containing protein n=1 Tax=Calidris pygmaea TaxID=425635 RepID=A0A8C3KRF2_9CHAR
ATDYFNTVSPSTSSKESTAGGVFSFLLCVGVIAVVIFTILCTLVFLIRYMFRHKGTYHTNEAKGAESAESADAAIMNNDPNFTETIDESKKEWLI